MSFSGRTPESIIPRSDSRNPATTCKGITKSGRPCRRPIDAKASQDDGVLAVASVVSDEGDEEIGAAAYFCWQHKDQAEQLVAQDRTHDTHLYSLKERNSIDTLVERLGVLEVDVNTQAPRRKRREDRVDDKLPGLNRPPRRINRPPTWDKVEGPLISIPSDVMAEERRRRTRPPKPPPQRKKPSFWASLCCAIAEDEDDQIEVVRHKRRRSHVPATQQYAPPAGSQQNPHQQPASSRPPGSRRSSGQSANLPASISVVPASAMPARKPLAPKAARPMNTDTNRRVSETTQLLQYIPATLSPQLTSTLLAELSKPISPHDDEGYIYIFWLTPDALGPAPSSAASNLLTPPARPDQQRRTSDVLRQYSVKRPQGVGSARRPSANDDTTKDRDAILLKIGRANNVHRRMNEWTRQCGYTLSLVRYYPYVSSTPSPSAMTTPKHTPTPSPQTSPANSRRPSAQRVSSGNVRKVPHAHRVERLIHLELGAQRVMKKCDACGKEHREWFEVEASREGVKRVDEVVKRWVDWAEKKDQD